MLSGVACRASRISRAAIAQTINAAMKTTAKETARFSAEPLAPTGMCGATSGENHCAANHAATQPTSDSNSNTKPRIAPTITEMTSTAIKAASTQPIWEKSMARRQRVSTTALSPAALALASAFSASSRESNGPARTRVRLPLEVSTTCM